MPPLFWTVPRRFRRRRRHASAGVDPRSLRRRADASLSLSSEPCPFSPPPSPSSHAWVEPSSNRAIAGRRADHPRRSASIARTPSRFTSPRSSTTPSRARLSRSPAKSAPRTPRPPLLLPEASPLPSNSLSRPSSARFERTVRFLATSSFSPSLSPLKSRAAGVGTPPRRRGRRAGPPAHAAGCSCASPGAPAARLGP